MNKATKFICILLCALLCMPMVLTACDTNSDVEPGADIITIYIRHFEDWSDDYFVSAIDKYNEDKTDGVHIEYLILDESNYSDKIISDREAGKAPDIYLCSWAPLWAEVQNGNILPIKDYFSQEFLDDYTDTALEYSTLYDTVYAVPYCFEPSLMLFYSKSAFAEAGITKEPTTYEEMLDCCEKLSKVIDNKKQTVLGTPLGSAMAWANVGQFWNSAGGNYPLTEDWSTSLVGTINKDGYKQFLEYWGQLYEKGYASRSDVAGGYNEIINELCEGRVAMTFAGSYAVGAIKNDYLDKGYIDSMDDIGCCLAPSLNGEIGNTTDGGWSIVLDSASAQRECTNEKNIGKTHADLAAKFIDWYVRDPEISTGWFELGLCCKQTGFKSVQTLLDKSQTANPFYEVIKEAANTACPTYYFPYMADYCSQMIQTYISKTNKKSLDEIIAICDSNVSKCIETYKLAGKNPKYQED